ncbi:subtilisin-like serine protease [Salinarchaeum sp. Harcht-Bsk1]|uniref:S8 family serine peptidase n=1 Tax=Salinarchaeum sp. Harcht-Bsk1 TaxID=1333523 RepID=UPI00034232A4|nr:S8 family serine peptidase [Salinarchaeum sp. Harcht-Bsk1]AGN02152.1 subtilisin-like serine protease [Salinarchaeum sp. Harcht-Bsk1]
MPDSVPSTGRRAFLGAVGGGGLATVAGRLDAEWHRAAAADEPLDVVVRFEGIDDPRSIEENAVSRLKQHAGASHDNFRRFAATTAGIEIRREFWLADAVLARVDPGVVTLEAIAAVDAVSEIRPNDATSMTEGAIDRDSAVGSDLPRAKDRTDGARRRTGRAKSATTAGSARIGQQGDGAGPSYGLEQIHAPTVWDFYGARGEGVDVAVLDSGVDPEGHEGIQSALDRGGWMEFDDGGERVESDPYDPNGHGTGTSGLVVGDTTDDGVQYGVAPAAALYHAKVVGEDGLAFAPIVAGLEWAIEQGVDVVSMSLGPLSYPAQLVEPLENARASGVLVVGAVGNAGHYTSASPGNMPTVVGVGAVDRDGTVTDFSGGERILTDRYWGGAAPDGWPDEYTVPDVTAAGVEVPSAEPGGSYSGAGGASAAAPQVAGAAALALSAARAADADGVGVEDLERALVDAAVHPDRDDPFAVDPGEDDRYGAGVASALFAATELVAGHTITGTVYRPDGSPMPGALVGAEVGRRTRTDAEGRFELTLPAGEQPIGAGAIGYEVDATMLDPASTNEVEFTPTPADGPAVGLTEAPPDRIEAGGAATATFTAANVEFATVDVTTEGLLQRADLGLRVNGKSAQFGEPVEVDAVDRTPEFTVTIEVPEGARVGSVTADLAVSRNGEDRFGELPTVRVHSDPLRVGERVPSIQAPVDLVAPGTTIELGDATFSGSGGDGPSTLRLNKPVSLVAATDASPRIEIDGASDRPGIYVGANDVEIDGVTIDAPGASAGVQIGTEPQNRETDAPSAATIRNGTVRGGDTGVDVRVAPAAVVEANDVTGETVGISIIGPGATIVRGNDVHDVETGLALDGLAREVADNRFRGIGGTAIRVGTPQSRLDQLDAEPGPIRNNVVEGAAIGIEVTDGAAVGDISGNEFREVESEIVGLDGAGSVEEDSAWHLVLYGATGLSLVALLVPYARRRITR